MRLFHGTTLKKLLEAIQKGYYGDEGSIWNVSEPCTTYFYGEDFVREESGCDKTPMEDAELALKNEPTVREEEWYLRGLQFALENADITLAQERRQLRRVVLVLKTENLNKLGENKVDKDISCDNAYGCFQFEGKIPLDVISEIWIDKEDRDLYAIYFIGLASYLQKHRIHGLTGYDEGISSELLEASEKVYELLNMWFLENLDSPYSIEEMTINKIKRIWLKNESLSN